MHMDLSKHLTGVSPSSYRRAQAISQEAHTLDFRKLHKNNSRARLCVKLNPRLCKANHAYQRLTDEILWGATLPRHPVMLAGQYAKLFQPPLARIPTTLDAGSVALLLGLY